MSSLQEQFRGRLRALGFDEVRFATIGDPALPAEAAALQRWLAAGMQAEMNWMERTADKRAAPGLVLSGVKSIVMLGVNYWSEAIAFKHDSGRPRWARYALYEDYHDTMRSALVAAGRTLEEMYGAAPTDYRYYVDTGPVLERSWAARSGLGFTGKNAMLISRQHGNWLFLAGLLTTTAFTPDPPIARSGGGEGVGLLCGNCTRCLSACPTDAFPAPGVVDARRCVSYQTIENKGIIPRELRAGIGHRIYGCDVCLEVCPWNRFAQSGRQLILAARHDLAELTLTELLALTPERFAAVFRRTPIKRLKLTGLLRNACVVAGNSGDVSLIPTLLPLATGHPAPLVRAHAVWAIRQLGGHPDLAAAQRAESDPDVLGEYTASID
jgi:epoxyqueuosine reductase